MNKPYPNGDTEQLMELNGIVIYRLAPFLFSNINGITRDIHKFFKEDVQMKNGIITRAENKLVMCCAKANHLMIQSQEQTAATINQLMSTKWGKYAVAIPAALSGMTITAFASGGSVWVIKPGQTLPKHYHHNSDDIWVILQGKGVFYPTPDTEVPFTKGQVIVSKKGECHGAKNTGTDRSAGI